MDNTSYFNTTELLNLFNKHSKIEVTKNDLNTVLRAVRSSSGKTLAPIFTPETKRLAGNYIFTQRDYLKLIRYFRALKEYKAARGDLRKTGKPPNTDWIK